MADNHWMLIINGLCATVVITLLSLALGTLLGGGIYAMTLSRRSWIRKVKNALPAYKFQAVSMVKSTSIVGYVAIMDLAKVTEAIRFSTGQSFLPLLIITILYFILAWLLTKLLDYIAYKTTLL